MNVRPLITSFVSVVVACLQLSPAFARVQEPQRQTPAARPTSQAQPESPYEDEVVRITTSLVQVDAVVTDERGRQVTDLRPEDFEILEDGKARAITNFAYVRVGGAAAEQSAPAASAGKSKAARAVSPPVTSLRPEQVRRTVALVLDDVLMSFEDVAFARRALAKFVDEQMQPGDLVAVLRTSAGTGALQQFTSDKRLLHAAVESLRWKPLTSGGINAVAPIDPDADGQSDASGGRTSRPDQRRDSRKEMEEARQVTWESASLSAMNQIVQGLQELPGRKAVVLVSDGLPLKVGDELSTPLVENMRRVIERANRASVVVYTIDARGLQDLVLSTADDQTGMSGHAKPRPETLYNYQTGPLAARREAYFGGQDGLIYLSEQTGGFNVRNNDIAGGILRAVEDQNGFYLLGYRPDEGTFDRKTGRPDFRKLVVRVRGRGGLRVRARKGFYAVPEEREAPTELSGADPLRRALVSPFTSAGVAVGLTSLYGNEAGAGSFIRSLLHFDVRDLSFEQQPDGRMRASVEVLAVLANGAGEAVDQVRGTHTFSVARDSLERLRREGMDYVLNVPVKRPGGYQLRVAVRDAAPGRVGTASRFVEAPDFEGGGLALSGLIISGSAGTPEGSAPRASEASEVESGPAVRRLRQGMMLDYGLVVYNAQAERATGRPKLTTQVSLFRGGQRVYAGSPTPLDTNGQRDPRRIVVGGRLQLGEGMEPGDYVLQVVVTDAARQKPVALSQWIDFELVR
jgi:VWFA-related protein